MAIMGRRLGRLLGALFEPRHYLGVLRGGVVYRRPLRQIWRYVTMTGFYPDRVAVRTPLGLQEIALYAPDDLVTVNEIFCRNDYLPRGQAEVVVDLGANIGVSALYWLTRSRTAFVYLYEPLPQNLPRLKDNLAGFEGRFALAEAAVGLETGDVAFNWEPTGRYGGIAKPELADVLEVPCIDIVDVIADVLAEHGRIDLLKVDVEGLETALLDRIPADALPLIGQIVAEHPYARNPWPELFHMRVRGLVTTFTRR